LAPIGKGRWAWQPHKFNKFSQNCSILAGCFCPVVATVYTDQGEIWHRSMDYGSALISNIIKNIPAFVLTLLGNLLMLPVLLQLGNAYGF